MTQHPVPARSGLADPAVQAVQRRTVGVLIAAQALAGLGNTVGITVASVLAEDLSGSTTLAGSAQTMQVLGAAVASYLIARVMGARGRRLGLVVGYGVGAGGAGLCVVAGALESFPLLILGTLLVGSTSASNYQARYVAADLALPQHRARALSTVLWATTFGAVLGPNLVGPAGRVAVAWGLPALTGPFLMSLVVVAAGALVVLAFLRPYPLQVAKQVAADERVATATPAPTRTRAGSFRRVRALARQHPGIGAGMLAMSTAHAVMVAVMVMTPLHMDHGGAALQVIGLVISVHVLGMFFFSPLMGVLADRWGRPTLLLAGAVVMWAACLLAGISPAGASTRIGVGLFLLGLGWSACTVSASTLITESTPIEDRTDVQGTSDLLMNLSAALAGALGGVVVDLLDYAALNLFAAVLVLGVLLAAVNARKQDSIGVAE